MQKRYFETLFRNSRTEVLADIYADLGISGTRTDFRPEFQRLMTDCRRGLIDRVICKSISRFARNTRDCLTAMRELKALGITIMFEKEGIDTARISDEIMITVLEGLAQEESMSISRNVRWSLSRRMKNGTMKVARVPYGYKKDKDRNLVIDDEKADIVREIFSLYLSGQGGRRISMILNGRGILSPTGIMWDRNTVLKILAQEKYLGDIRWQKTCSTFMGEKNKINRGEQESYYIRNSHPPIIDRETFALAREIREKSKCKTGKTSDPDNCNIFKSKLTCSCGRSFILSRSKVEDYWICSRSKELNNTCNAPAIMQGTVERVWKSFYSKLRHFASDIFLPVLKFLEELEENIEGGLASELESEIKDLYDRRYTLRKLCMEGVITEDKFIGLENELISEAKEIEDRLDNLTGLSDEMTEDLKNIYNSVFIMGEEQFFNKHVEKIVIRENTAEIVLKCGLKFREVI